jgi:hypothetical protein
LLGGADRVNYADATMAAVVLNNTKHPSESYVDSAANDKTLGENQHSKLP